jgi:Concanavalin A-like lectin/glucanases superfamily
MDEGTGNLMGDSSFHLNTGALNGTTWADQGAPIIPFPSPVAYTGPSVSQTTNSVMLTGAVSPNGLACTGYFEYGFTTNYGLRSPAIAVADSPVPVAVTNLVSGLVPAQPGHYRLTVSNSAAIHAGADRTSSSAGAGGAGFALNFTGPQVAALQGLSAPSGCTNLTFEVWVKPSNLTATAVSELIRNDGGTWIIGFAGHGTLLRFHLETYPGYYTYSLYELNVPIDLADWTDGNWHHVAAVYDGEWQRLYKDGAQVGVGRAAGTPTIGGATNLTYVGFGDWFSSTNLVGLMDEVRIWTVARTQAEIARCMNVSLPGTQPGLLVYWRFDEGTGGFASDASGNGHTLNLGYGGSPVWVPSTAPINASPVQVRIATPLNSTFVSDLAPVSGSALDAPNGGGVASVSVSVQRVRDGLFWTGSGWTPSGVPISATVSDGTWACTVGLPSGANLPDSAYIVSAVASDNAGYLSAPTSIEVSVVAAGAPPAAVWLDSGGLLLTFPGIAGTTYRVQASTDLISWSVVGTVTVSATGLLQFEDAEAYRYPFRFYRTVTP